MPPYNRWERATLQAIQQAVDEVADGAASFTWGELPAKTSAVSSAYMSTHLVRASTIDLHRKGIIGIEYADEDRAEGVTIRLNAQTR